MIIPNITEVDQSVCLHREYKIFKVKITETFEKHDLDLKVII